MRKIEEESPVPTFTLSDMKRDNREMEVNAIRKFCRYLCHKYLDLLKLDAALFDAPLDWGHGKPLLDFGIVHALLHRVNSHKQ